MSDELPIACSLTASDFDARLAQMAELGRDALIHSDRQPTHARLRFAAGAGVRERVEALASAEASCCSFLTIGVSEETDIVVLEIIAPVGAESVLGELVSAFADHGRAA